VNNYAVVELSYIASAILFIYGIKMMARPETARRANLVSAVGMAIAILATCLSMKMHWQYILVGGVIGSVIGAWSALKVPMTSMPEFVAFFNGAGGLASMLVGWAEYHTRRGSYDAQTDMVAIIATFFAILIGAVTFTGSMIAGGKLAEIPWRIESRLKKKSTGLLAGLLKPMAKPLALVLDQKPVLFKGQQWVNGLIVMVSLACGAAYIFAPNSEWVYAPFAILVVVSLVLGVLSTIGIGGADMPVVISLLNSYSGLAGCAAGFVISNTVLIVAGSLVGASGIILTQIMCKAMNRSLANVLFSGFGSGAALGSGKAVEGEATAISADDAYYVLEAASFVVIVPGYGMAVAQAQHAVRELADLLQANGAEVKFAIHPVAGRMPGHMNVLLAEANVPYEQLVEMDDINPVMPNVDVCIVIGANDVVNPAAREDETSPIYGMPIINVDQARTVFVVKRSMRSGFAGIENPLFYKENVRMVFGDAKKVVESLIGSFKS
jgi:NAD(P) transhydrogenase subunit beta